MNTYILQKDGALMLHKSNRDLSKSGYILCPFKVSSPEEVEIVEGTVVLRPTMNIILENGILKNIPEGANIIVITNILSEISMDSSQELDISELLNSNTEYRININYKNYKPYTYETETIPFIPAQ